MNNLYYNPKRLKQIKKKRTQKTKKIWGWILTALGGLELVTAITSIAAGASLTALIAPLIFLLPGLFLLWTAKRQVDRWDQYEAIIDNRGNTSLSLIARKMGLPEKRVIADLQEMIHSDFFIGPNYNIEAYVDAEHDMLVMASNGQPLRPVPDRPEREEAQQTAQRQAGAQAKQEQDEEITEEEFKEVELTDLEQIQQAIARTKDDDVRAYLYGLEGSVRRIDERMQDEPELMQKMSIKRLYKYYLPQILELIDKYQDPDTSAELKAQIKDALQTSAGALANIEADLLEREQMDAEVDIEVLKNMFAQDGLLDRGQGQAGYAAAGAKAGAKAGQAAGAQAQAVGGAGAAQAQAQAAPAGAAQAQSAGASQAQVQRR